MNQQSITIISHDTKDTTGGAYEVLNKLPFCINIISYTEWLQAPLNEQGQAIVIFISGTDIPNKAFFNRIDELISIPKLCLLDNSCILKQLESIDRYNDIIIWPCSSEEIFYRVNQVIKQYSNPKCSNSLDAKLIKAFIKMNLVGNSLEFAQTLSYIHKAAMHDLSVLLLGETGTGKELAARAIHSMGLRAKSPFIPVNCGALPENIFENEVFGHKPGAYTDAKKSQLGLVGQAQGGTLFLDEIDSLSLKSQVALLRFLQDHQYRPLGAQAFEIADVRLISATNTDLERLTKLGHFRQDLYYRLNIIQITMPALRERLDDLPMLITHLSRRFKVGGTERTLSASSYRWMNQYSWPGNIRELENVLLRAFSESEERVLTLPPLISPLASTERVNISGVNWDIKYNEAKNLVINSFEKRYLKHILTKTDGNISEAARHAGKERRSLGKLIKKHGLKEY